MSDKTSIEWCDATWPVVAGCNRVSLGCDNCWAIRHSRRLAGNPNREISKLYEGTTTRRNGRLDWSGKVRCLPERLDWPLRWKKPRRVFVCPMGDLFHEQVQGYFIHDVFATMAVCQRHTFQILTKRPKRMRDFLTMKYFPEGFREDYGENLPWPLPNLWIGVSAEDQKTFDERVSELLKTPAAVRFVSFEPLLGSINVERALQYEPFHENYKMTLGPYEWHGLVWVIVGSESGPGRRETNNEWVRLIRDQCIAARVPFFLKQLHINGKKLSLPELDGKQWNQFPTPSSTKPRRSDDSPDARRDAGHH